MQDVVVATSQTPLLWLLMLLMRTAALFGWRCYRAGALAMFGRFPSSGQALARLAVAASLPVLLRSGWFSVNPEMSAWA